MKILALDTSTNHFSMAIGDGEKILAVRTMKNDRALSSKIIPAMDKLFIKSGIEPRQIDAIAIGTGPGSFTSLRVGIATAKGLAYALKKPVIGVPSLDVVAMNVKQKISDQACIVFDAKRGLVYAAVYQYLDGNLERLSDYLLVEPQKILKFLKGTVAFAGDGVPLFKEFIKEKKRSKSSRFSPVFLEEREWYPSAKNLSLIARARYEYKDFDDIGKLVPLYLYPEDCQVQKKQGKAKGEE
ncbi:MAG: tRNA (adenosine(37)-N6)-threonylcarbamoyltransferase complex dimerization subunit type 1 TsaB [Candidatus Omnitrophota bacterium]